MFIAFHLPMVFQVLILKDFSMSLFLRRESLWIPVILLVILVGAWSELDLYAPSFPLMMHHFGTTEQMMQWTLSLNFLGFFLASLVCGPLADAIGRRKIILGGSLIFVVGSIVCLFSNTIEIMLLGRLIQGIGVSAPISVSMAVIGDIYQGDRQVRLMSRLNSTITITMALAPVAGVYLTENFGWRINFLAILVLAALGLLLCFLFVPETHEEKSRTKFELKSLVGNYLHLLKSKDFLALVVGLCFSVTPYFILIGILPLLFMEELGVSIHQYAFYQGSIVGLYSVLSLCMPMILSRFSVTRIVQASVMLILVGLGSALVVSITLPDNPIVITLLMWIYVTGIVIPPTMMFCRSMDMFPKLRACSSSLIQSLRMLSMSLGTAVAGSCYDGNFRPIVAVMFVFALLSVPATIYALRRRGDTEMMTESLPAMH